MQYFEVFVLCKQNKNCSYLPLYTLYQTFRFCTTVWVKYRQFTAKMHALGRFFHTKDSLTDKIARNNLIVVDDTIKLVCKLDIVCNYGKRHPEHSRTYMAIRERCAHFLFDFCNKKEQIGILPRCSLMCIFDCYL